VTKLQPFLESSKESDEFLVAVFQFYAQLMSLEKHA